MSAFKSPNTSRLHQSLVVCVLLLNAASGYAQIPANPLAGSAQEAAPAQAPLVSAPPKSQVIAPPIVPVAVAQPVVTVPNSPAAQEIQRINENMALLQTQLNQLELQVKVAEKKKILNGLNGGGSTFSSFDPNKGNPSVISVAGIKGQLEAVLVFPGGSTQRVKEGDVIDERRVTKINANEVVLANIKDKSQQRLTFGTTAIVRESSIGSPSSMSLPR
jgi:type IV pilus biogenesis protein PilP